jgi:hypothetical protein
MILFSYLPPIELTNIVTTIMSLHALGISVDVNIRQLSDKKKLLNYSLSWNTFEIKRQTLIVAERVKKFCSLFLFGGLIIWFFYKASATLVADAL